MNSYVRSLPTKIMAIQYPLPEEFEKPIPVQTFEVFASDRESVKILIEAARLQRKKGQDYNGSYTSVQQADYYVHGLNSIMDIIHAKYLRAKSVMEAMDNDPNYKPNFESLEDSFLDAINYCSFAAAWCRGKVPGQNPDRDLLNRRVTGKVTPHPSDSDNK